MTSDSAKVLVVDDDPDTRAWLERMLQLEGHRVISAGSACEARDCLRREPADLMLTDVWMPGEGGISLLRSIGAEVPELPVVLMTADATRDAVDAAFEHRAFHLLRKPITRAALARTVRRALSARQEQVEAAAAVEERRDRQSRRFSMRRVFEAAMDELYMDYQPILDASGAVFGHEALVRTRHPEVPHPGVFFELGRATGGLGGLAARIREAAPAPFSSSRGGTLFINLLPSDLEDPSLYEPDTPLARMAERVVLEITERAPLRMSPELERRVALLRELGYRLAVDDLGAGYAGLSSLAALEPDIVKLDRSLVSGVDRSPKRQRLVRSIACLCSEEGAQVVAEGIERVEERDSLRELGCTLFQGFLFARPASPFPSVAW